MEISEFQKLIDLCRKSYDFFLKLTCAAYFIFQFHMIECLDDVFCFQRVDLTPNLEFPFTFKSKMRWSKNMLEKRDAHDQIILGAMDLAYCSILAIAIHLVHNIHSGGMASVDNQSLFCVKKERIANLFRKITQCNSFSQIIEGKLGTHSIRKLPATYAWRNGCSCDDIDASGRWKVEE